MGSRIRLILIAELVAVLVAVTTNVATNVLPDSWRPYLWLAWPALAVLVVSGIGLAVFAYRADTAPGPGSAERTVFYRRAMVARLRRVWIEDVLERTLFLESASASDDPATASAAANTLARLKATSRSQRGSRRVLSLIPDQPVGSNRAQIVCAHVPSAMIMVSRSSCRTGWRDERAS